MAAISSKVFDNLEKNLNESVCVVFNEDDYLAIYDGKLSKYSETGIELLVNEKYTDKLPFFQGKVRKIFHIYTRLGFDLFNNRQERTLDDLLFLSENIKIVRTTLKKNFKNKVVAVVIKKGKVSLIKGDLVEFSDDSLRLQRSYYEKEDVPFVDLLHLYDSDFVEILRFPENSDLEE